MKFLLLFLLPLFLIINFDAFALDYDLECPVGEMEIIRATNPDPICVNSDTAQRWVGMGIAEYVELASEVIIGPEISEEKPVEIPVEIIPEEDVDTLPELLGTFADAISAHHYENIPDELSRAHSYLVTFSNGELTEPLVIQTFSKVDPGDAPHILPTFQELGFDTYFVLAATPSKDKIEFYDLIAKTINPGKPPELFDVSVDVLAGDNSVILTANYANCEITDYLPYTQDFLLFYQFSDMVGKEIRDRATLYCTGMDLDVHNPNDPKIISDDQLPFAPSLEERIKGYVVHFNGPDFDGLYTVETFSDFSPSIDFIESPFDTITIPGNPLDNTRPQFFLESLPSTDKMELYEYFAMYVNPGQPPKPVDVSVDLITGDGTILQRWNYNDCSLYEHSSFLEDSFLKYSYKETPGPEIRDKSEFICAGTNLEIHGDKVIPTFPIRDPKNFEQESTVSPTIAPIETRGESFRIHAYDGELNQIHSSENLQKFESIRKDRGPLTPLNHAKQYDFGFAIESLPEKNKSQFYEFVSRYVNPGKAPEPFDVSLDVITGNDDVLYRLDYANCAAIDFLWYLQQGEWVYQFSEAEDGEIRERYIFYCEGFGVSFPEES